MSEYYAPYAPPENLDRLFTRVRANGWPARVTTDYLNALGLSEGNIPRVLQALKFLRIIDETGAPTEFGESLHLAPEGDWSQVLLDGLRTAYAPIFKVANPETSPRQLVRDAFRPMNPKGQQERMTTLFLGLCIMAGLDVQDRPSQRPGQGVPRKAAKPVTKRQRTTNPQVTHTSQPQTSPSPYRLGSPGGLHPALAGVLAAVPELQSEDDLERWIESFRATFLMVKNVRQKSGPLALVD
jgi:hypothetical protein